MAIKIFRNDHGTFTAVCPSLPGCLVIGQTREEARQKIDEAIAGYIAAVNNCCAEQDINLVEAH